MVKIVNSKRTGNYQSPNVPQPATRGRGITASTAPSPARSTGNRGTKNPVK